jgi:photosystem II stability/assembly factor-like uncharacterized protein
MIKNRFDGLLEWRCIGPFRGGRVITVAGDPRDANTFYFGAVCGGVWKTTDAGQYWQNITDGYFTASSVGAIEVAPADPNVIYAGTGESTIRIDVSIGDGMYKSTDSGRTWKHIGLKDTRQISKVRTHPDNADLVYVAALGHAFGQNDERGVYRSKDGGDTWENVLHVSNKSGAVDISIDKNNPRIIYATFWEAYRNFWQISSGGEDSGIWRSMDGGDTWENITENKGLPKGTLGKMGIVTSPVQAGRVWAIVEHQPDGGLYRSDDYGDTWTVCTKDNRLISRAWYYMHLTADPIDANTVYINNLSFWKSTDAGNNFTEITTPHGDNHDVWINPNNNQVMVQGNDGGANVTLNGGLSWSSIHNQPTAQFYHLDVDNQTPYRIYGTQQDNSSLSVPSRSTSASIVWGDVEIAGYGESGYIAVKPDDPTIVYVGAIGSSPGGGNSLQRYDHKTKQIRLVSTSPRSLVGHGVQAEKYRFAWTYPIIFSPHDANTLYIGGNVVLKTTNDGQTWEVISPDLTKADPETLKPTGGPINLDAVGAEHYATVFTFAESPHEAGVLWAGSDDGLMHISKDSGANWENITPPDLPDWTMFNMIECSSHDKATVYVTATRFKNDDYAPYVFKTTDYGQTWTSITAGITDDHFTRAIREDPNREGLLYLGTEFGLYVSFNAGDSWESFQLNLPITPIYDLKVKNNDLIVGTHGRAFWVLDDLTLLHRYSDSITDQSSHLFTPYSVERRLPKVFEGMFESSGAVGKQYGLTAGLVMTYTTEETPEHGRKLTLLDSGANPPNGAVITYYLKEKPESTISLTFKDTDGNEIKSFKSIHADDEGKDESVTDDDKPKELRIPSNVGWNRFVWDLRYADAEKVIPHNDNQMGYIKGPHAVPGTYQATLSVGGDELTESFDVIKETGVVATQDELQKQFDLLLDIRDKVSDTHKVINQMRDVRIQLKGWQDRIKGHDAADSIVSAAKDLEYQVLEIEKQLMIPDTRAGWPDKFNNGDRLAVQLSTLTLDVALGDYQPTDEQVTAFGEMVDEINAEVERFNDLVNGNLAEFNTMLSNAGFGKVVLKVG